MKIQILGAHNMESRQTRYMTVLIDEVLALDAGGLTSSLSFAAQQKIKALFLTHHHYDHIRDVPAFAMGAFLHEKTINIYATQTVRDALTTYFLNGELYPNFLQKPPEKPTINFTVVEPDQTIKVAGYDVTAVPVSHAVPAVGYQVTSPQGKTLFYTGDTGPGLADCWQHINPRLLLIEVTAPNQWEQSAKEVKHLTPNLLQEELDSFQKMKGYLPRVVAVHINPREETEIKTELAAVARSLKASITLAREGMLLHL